MVDTIHRTRRLFRMLTVLGTFADYALYRCRKPPDLALGRSQHHNSNPTHHASIKLILTIDPTR